MATQLKFPSSFKLNSADLVVFFRTVPLNIIAVYTGGVPVDVHFSFVTPAGVRIIVPGTGAVILGKAEKTNKFFRY